MVTSPEAKDYIFDIMSDRDFESVKSSIGSVTIPEIVELHKKIISSINKVFSM
jgi:hypothetical protein